MNNKFDEFDESAYEDQLNNDLSFQQESYEIMQAISKKMEVG